MNNTRHPSPRHASVALLMLLTACGGGGGNSDNTPAPPPSASTVRIDGKAIDGPLQGATACYDLDDNGACDPNDPKATTDAAGVFALDVDAAQAGRHRLVVEVPATAVDMDTGAAVGSAFRLVAPASGNAGAQSIVASPLGTLVQAQMEASGDSLSNASAFIQAQSELAVSPLADYTASSAAESRQAGLVARLLLATQLKTAESVAAALGTTDATGHVLTQSDLDSAVTQALVGALPALSATAATPAIAQAASPQALRDAIAAAAADLVNTQIGLDADGVRAASLLAHLPPEAVSSAAEPAASFVTLSYSDANNWFYRTLLSTTEDNTPDASGRIRYYDLRLRSSGSNFSPAGVVEGWSGTVSKARQGDLHWNGSAWAGCPLGTRGTSTVRDAQGRSSYSFCDNLEEGTSLRRSVDVSGQGIATVVQQRIRSFPGEANGVAYAQWGPSDLGLFGSAAFPQGSKLYYQTNVPLKSAPSYVPTSPVRVYTAGIAAGGDARSGSPACAQVTSANSASFLSVAATLEDVVARNPGHACVFNQNTNADGSSLNPNEWWSNSTLDAGTAAAAATPPAGTASYYTSTAIVRIGFTGGNGVAYYSCLQRHSDGSSRNCTAIGSGTYTIQTLGDARVMSFTGQPALVQRVGWMRTLVERGGQVFYGWTNPVGMNRPSLRLNLAAASAVLDALHLPPLKPVASAASMSAEKQQIMSALKGVWGGATDTGAIVFRFGDGGAFTMGEAGPANAVTREQSGTEVGFIDVDPTTRDISSLLALDSNLTSGTSHPDATSRLTTLSATQLGTPNGTLGRLPSGPGIVGLWALRSATDLGTHHIAFFDNGRVLLMDNLGETDTASACFAARQGPAGAEFASYTFDAVTGALRVFNKQYDTNGCGGFFDSSTGGTPNTEANLTVTIGADGKTATLTGPDIATPIPMFRIPSQ